jgi:hypothetical protein
MITGARIFTPCYYLPLFSCPGARDYIVARRSPAVRCKHSSTVQQHRRKLTCSNVTNKGFRTECFFFWWGKTERVYKPIDSECYTPSSEPFKFYPLIVQVEVEVTLRLTVNQSVSMSWYRTPLWDLRPDIISCRNVAVYGAPSLTRGRVCSTITQLSELCRTHNHTLLSHLRLPQPGGPSSRIYIPQE